MTRNYNLIPYIPKEEEKVQTECRKILRSTRPRSVPPARA